MANLIRTARSWFFESSIGSTGDRLNTGNKPTKETFKKLLDSFLNPLESDDTAKLNTAGHVKLASDDRSMSRTNIFETDTEPIGGGDPIKSSANPHSIVVTPYQLPNLETSDGTEASVVDTAVTSGGIIITPIKKMVGASAWRKNFRLALSLFGSLKITNNKLGLDGDVDSPDEEQFYGMRGEKKGWYNIASSIPAMGINTVNKVLSNNGTSTYWKTDEVGTGSGSSSTPADGESIFYNGDGKLQLKEKPYVVPIKAISPPGAVDNNAMAAVVKHETNGVYVNIDVNSLIVKDGGILAVKPTGAIISDKVIVSDDFIGADINTNLWDVANGSMVNEDKCNGIVFMPTDTALNSTFVSLQKISPAVNPTIDMSFKFINGLGVLTDIPVVKIGFIGDGSSVSGGDFVGVILVDTEVPCWQSVVTNNGVSQTLTKTDIAVDSVAFHKLSIFVYADGSAQIYMDNIIIGEAAAGVIDFDSVQKAYVEVEAASGETCDLFIDYIMLSSDRNTDGFTYTRVIP